MFASCLHMTVNQPVQLEIFIIVTKGVDELFGDLEKAHVEEKLKNGENGNVEINFNWHPATWHPLSLLVYTESFDLLSANDGEDEEEVGGEGDHLSVHHRYGHPVVAPQQPALGSEFTKLLNCFDLQMGGGGVSCVRIDPKKEVTF